MSDPFLRARLAPQVHPTPQLQEAYRVIKAIVEPYLDIWEKKMALYN